jgi:hypothetical protein
LKVVVREVSARRIYVGAVGEDFVVSYTKLHIALGVRKREKDGDTKTSQCFTVNK